MLLGHILGWQAPSPTLINGKIGWQGVCFTWSLRDLDWWKNHPSRKYNLITRWIRWRWRVSDQKWNTAAWKWHTPLPLRVHWSELLTWITQLQRGWKMHFSKFLEKENWILVSSGNGCFRSLWYLSFFKLNIHNSINWFSYDMVSTAVIFLTAHLSSLL